MLFGWFFRLLIDVSIVELCVCFSVTPGISPRESFSFSNKITFFGMLDMFTVYIRVIKRNIINKVLFKNFKTGHPICRVTSF